MEQDLNQLQKLKNYLIRSKGSRYPFSGHRLAGEEPYLQNLYLKHLCLVLRCGKSVSEPQSLFLQRLIAGCGAEYDLAAYMRQSQDITPEVLEEFLGHLEPGGLLEPFLMDMLLLTHLDEADEERQIFAAELCEACRVPLHQMDTMTQLCAGVLRQNLAECIRIYLEQRNVLSPDLASPYFPAIVPRTQSSTEREFVVSGGISIQPVTGLGEVESFDHSIMWANYKDAGSVAFRSHSIICFYHMQITVNTHLRFYDADRVELIGCTFEADGRETLEKAPSIWFSRCKEIVIRDCTFRNFSGRVIYALDSGPILMEGTTMKDCVVKYNQHESDWKSFGGMIYTDDVSPQAPLTLRNCRFTNCGGLNNFNYFASSIISNCCVNILGCHFENCWNVHAASSGRIKDPADSRRCLFMNILEESGNEVVESAKLGPN